MIELKDIVECVNSNIDLADEFDKDKLIFSIDHFKYLINECVRCDTDLKMNGFSMCNNFDDHKNDNFLMDENDDIICCICYDKINLSKSTLVKCDGCNKYIGHVLCLISYIVETGKCPHCNYSIR